MRIDNLGLLIACGLGTLLCFESPQVQASDTSAPVSVSVGVERVSKDEVRFSITIANTSNKPVFTPGVKFNDLKEPEVLAVFFERLESGENWKALGPCWDVVPPDVVRIDAGAAVTVRLDFKLPIRVCRKQMTQFEGSLRIGFEYFETSKEGRAYLKLMDSPDWKLARAPTVFSEPFEIPPPKK